MEGCDVGRGFKIYPKILEAHLGDYPPYLAPKTPYKGGYGGGRGVCLPQSGWQQEGSVGLVWGFVSA